LDGFGPLPESKHHLVGIKGIAHHTILEV
jgi:hypothetical protein